MDNKQEETKTGLTELGKEMKGKDNHKAIIFMNIDT